MKFNCAGAFVFAAAALLLAGAGYAQQLSFAPTPAPEWSASLLKPCDRACLARIMNGYMNAVFHEVEAFPFVTIPYGLGNGWTEGSGR